MAKSEHVITVLTTPIGRYEWWPDLQLIDFVFKGKIKGIAIGRTKEGEKLDDALKVAARHLYNVTRRK